MRFVAKILLLQFLCSLIFCKSNAQCIAAFPYHETFETSNGGWVAGGTSSDWAWGSPTKPTISGAGQGLKCWITGGLTNSSYANGERSYVKSPCFDFTNLAHPYIEFKIFWESEHKYDGSNLQYSINNGTTWTNVGTINTVTDCYNANWYNYNPITYLTNLATVKDGWSGNIQATSGSCQGGNGSGAWVVAKHCLSNLAGQANVLFRFTFGAGTSCNAFDGVAFDDVYIQNAPRYTADFGYNCTTTSTFSFSDSSTNCPSAWHWNFGDVASANNTSTTQNATHIFSAPGLYNVQLIATNACSGSDTISKIISVLGVTIDSVNVACPNGSNGSANAIVIGANSTLNYSWNTSPTQTTDTAQNLVAGNYTITVSEAHTCSVSAHVHLTQPNNFTHSFSTTPSICGSANGSATVLENGGTPNYAYQWSAAGSTTNKDSNLVVGNYVVTITDQNNCVDTAHVVVPSAVSSFTHSFTTTPSVCGTANGSATVTENGGTPNYTYQWQPSVSATNTATNIVSGNYVVTITDQNTCVDTVHVYVPSAGGNMNLSVTNLSNVTCFGNNDGAATIQVNGGTPNFSYTWSPSGGNAANSTALNANNYSVTVIDGNNCTAQIQFSISQPAALQLTHQIQSTTCGKNNGSIKLNVTGGTQPYTYVWSPNATTTNQSNVLASGNYFIQVIDSHQCKIYDTAQINHSVVLKISASANADTCNEAKGNAMAQIISGTAPYQYVWQPSGSHQPFIKNLLFNSNYTVIVTDSNQCADSAKVFIPSLGMINLNLGDDTSICAGVETYLIKINSAYKLVWQDGSTNNSFSVKTPGEYFATAVNTLGCTAADTIIIGEHCVDVLQIPNAFSPNGDGLDDEFGGITNFPSDLVFYRITIYNRLGEMIFGSNNYYSRWDGKFGGVEQPIGVYVFMVEYNFGHSSANIFLKGDVTLMR